MVANLAAMRAGMMVDRMAVRMVELLVQSLAVYWAEP